MSSTLSSLVAWDPVEAAKSPSFPALWVLFLYSYLSALQSLLWMTWSSVPVASCAYLSIPSCNATLDLWLDYGPIAFCIAVVPATALLSLRGPHGIRDAIRLGLALCTLASLARALPLILPGGYSTPGGIAIVHVAQFLNGAVAPLAVSTPAALSLFWFSEDRRVLATATANVANAAGRAVGFWLGPAVASAAGDVPKLLVLEIFLAAVPAVAALLYCPAEPVMPPSRAAARAAGLTETKNSTKGAVRGVGASLRAATADMYNAARNVNFLLVCASGGLSMAAFGAWSGVLPTVLANAGFSPAAAGALGAVNTLAGCVGGLAAGVAADAKAFRIWSKTIAVVLALAAAAAFAPLAWAAQRAPGDLLLAAATIAGFLRGGTDPLFFELAADAAAETGATAESGGGLLTLIYHVLLCGMLSLSPGVVQSLALPGMPICLIVGAALLMPSRLNLGARRNVQSSSSGDEHGDYQDVDHESLLASLN
jgi:hypothetical protein